MFCFYFSEVVYELRNADSDLFLASISVVFVRKFLLPVDFNKVSRSLVFTSAVLLLFESFTTGPGYATNCNFVSISCSLSLLLLLLYLYLDICIYDLFSVESHLHFLHLNIRISGK